MKTSHWLGIVGFLIFLLVATELNRVNELGLALWLIYETLSVIAFTVAWISLVCCAVIWVYRLAVRGDVENHLDLVKAAQARYDSLYSRR